MPTKIGESLKRSKAHQGCKHTNTDQGRRFGDNVCDSNSFHRRRKVDFINLSEEYRRKAEIHCVNSLKIDFARSSTAFSKRIERKLEREGFASLRNIEKQTHVTDACMACIQHINVNSGHGYGGL